MRSTIAGSGGASVSGSASAPAWCAPALSPCTGSWSEYMPWPPGSAFRSTIDDDGRVGLVGRLDPPVRLDVHAGRLEERAARAIGEHDARVGDVQRRPAL